MRRTVRRVQSFKLVAQDIADVGVNRLHALSVAVGWPHRAKDWDLIRRAGQGIVAVDEIGRVFGSAMWFPQGEDFATIGLVITSPRAQAGGTGRWLMDQVLERCGNRKVALNATHAAYKLYVSLGFMAEAIVYQREGQVGSTLPATPVVNGELVALTSNRIDEVVALDTKAFGKKREKLLALLGENASICTLRRGGEIVGYSMCREFGRGHVVGPIIANNDHDAINLAAVHLKELSGRFARVDSRERDGAFADFLQQCNLGQIDTVTTMSKGGRFLHREENEPWVFGLAGHALS